MEETERILNYNNAELTTAYPLLKFNAITQNAKLNLSSIKQVVLAISSNSHKEWPSDETWETLLPGWFLNRIKSYSTDDIIRNSNVLWDYGSWLDAMRFRGWEWHSSKADEDRFSIILYAIDFPYSVNPLEYVIYETGIPLSQISFEVIS